MGGTTRTLVYQYDADGNRTRLTHPDAQAATYTYDGLDRIAGMYQGTLRCQFTNSPHDISSRPWGLRRHVQ